MGVWVSAESYYSLKHCIKIFYLDFTTLQDILKHFIHPSNGI